MSANKRQQTMAKVRREQAVRERRMLKQEKKTAARRAKAAGDTVAGPARDNDEEPTHGSQPSELG
jgi:hypothetical protein